MICRGKGGEMEGPFSRTELLLGTEGVKRLRDATVAVFGIGGVGGYVVEALARSGVGRLHLIDHDTVSVSNLNRQIIATVSTVGRYKVDVAKERVMEINPEAKVWTHRIFYMPETEGEFEFAGFDYVVDAIDTVAGKLALIMRAEQAGVPVASSMGAGNKLDASAFEVADIYQTSVCPLAKVMRRELKKRGVRKLKVVYSKEQPVTNSRPPGSNAFVPAAAGLILAGEVVKDLVGAGKEETLPCADFQ